MSRGDAAADGPERGAASSAVGEVDAAGARAVAVGCCAGGVPLQPASSSSPAHSDVAR
jgi:hypothetical protein